MNDFNYNEYDQITVTTKTVYVQKIITDYQRFGWEWIEKEKDGSFSNLVHLTFKRVHRLKYKDELQYLQVCYEEKLNTMFELEKNKNILSTLLFIAYSIFFSLFLTLGAVFFIQAKVFFGAVFVIFGVGVTCLVPAVIKLRTQENRKFQQSTDKLNQEIEHMLKGVVALSEDKDEN